MPVHDSSLVCVVALLQEVHYEVLLRTTCSPKSHNITWSYLVAFEWYFEVCDSSLNSRNRTLVIRVSSRTYTCDIYASYELQAEVNHWPPFAVRSVAKCGTRGPETFLLQPIKSFIIRCHSQKTHQTTTSYHDFIKSWKTSAVSTTMWMVETQLCNMIAEKKKKTRKQ